MSLLDTLNQYAGPLGLLGSLLGAGFALYLRAAIAEKIKGLATDVDLKAVQQDIEDHSDRITVIEATLTHLPNAQALQDLALNVTELRGALKTTGAELGGLRDMLETLSHQVQVMDGFLRNMKR